MDFIARKIDGEMYVSLDQVNKAIEEKNAEIENIKATHYAEMVDAGMRERKLKRAFYKACAMWADRTRLICSVFGSNAQIRPVDCAEAEGAFGDSPVLPYLPFLVKSSRLLNLTMENDGLTEKIYRLKAFLEGKQCEKIAGAKQIELMRGQLKAMENYKFFLSCRIADLALSDLEQSEKEKE